MKLSLSLIALAAMFFSTSAACHAALQGPFSAQLIGELQPVGLPAGIPYGGGGNSFEHRQDTSGSLTVVGAGVFRRSDNRGHAFVFDHSDPNNIRQIAHLRASDNLSGNEYGDGVAISGNYVFVTARGDRQYRGAVYMYDVSDPNNITERKITAFDETPYNSFGYSIDVHENRLIVGAPFTSAAATQGPAVYIVDFSDPDNIQQTKIDPPPLQPGGGFGNVVAISENFALVGQSSDRTEFTWAGTAQLYDISDLNNIRRQRLIPTDAPFSYRNFGDRVSLSGNTAVVSVSSYPGPEQRAGNPEGTVWAFDLSNWDNVQGSEYGRSSFTPGYFSPPFGRFLELDNGLAAAGAFNENLSTGAVYLNDVSDPLNPTELLRIPAPPGAERFGVSLALSGRTLIVSDLADHVYLYNIIPEPAAVALFTLAGLTLLQRRLNPTTLNA